MEICFIILRSFVKKNQHKKKSQKNKKKKKKKKKKRRDPTDDQFDRLMFDVDILSVKFFFNHSKNDYFFFLMSCISLKTSAETA